jgi:hypothetical protein
VPLSLHRGIASVHRKWRKIVDNLLSKACFGFDMGGKNRSIRGHLRSRIKTFSLKQR